MSDSVRLAEVATSPTELCCMTSQGGHDGMFVLWHCAVARWVTNVSVGYTFIYTASIVNPKDGAKMFLRNVRTYLPHHVV